jgi:hypothetical protein
MDKATNVVDDLAGGRHLPGPDVAAYEVPFFWVSNGPKTTERSATRKEV